MLDGGEGISATRQLEAQCAQNSFLELALRTRFENSFGGGDSMQGGAGVRVGPEGRGSADNYCL